MPPRGHVARDRFLGCSVRRLGGRLVRPDSARRAAARHADRRRRAAQTTPAAAAPAPAAAAPAAPAAAVVSDWNAAPTNGSPGVNAPKLSGNDLLKNNSFEGGKSIPWSTSFSAPAMGAATVKDGQLCVVVTNKGVNAWDAQVRHREMVIQKGHTYSIAYLAHATKPIQMKVKVGMSGPPYKEYWTDTSELTTHPQTFVGAFTMESADDASAELAFLLRRRPGGRDRRAVHRLPRRHSPRRSAVRASRRRRRPTRRRSPTCWSIRPATWPSSPSWRSSRRRRRTRSSGSCTRRGAPSSPRATPSPSARTPPRATTSRSPTSRPGRRRARTTRSGSPATAATRSTSARTSTRS